MSLGAHRHEPLEGVPLLLAQAPKEAPTSRNELFGDVKDDTPGGADGRLGIGSDESSSKSNRTSSLKGYVQIEAARTYASPAHWSKLRFRSDLATSGRLGERVKYRLGVRLDADAAYGQSDFYPEQVRDDERYDFQLRENFLDINAGRGFDLRIGRQHVVWGEMVGLYFADVVSARDLREFILPDFDSQRIPQWAARAEYFGNDIHAELLWIPVPSYDRIGKPGAEFFPAQPVPPGSTYLGEAKPARDMSNTNYGARVSGLFSGWDLSAFAYRSMDVTQNFVRAVDPGSPTGVAYQARHDRITQFGGTLSKDFGSVVLKSEAVRTNGRQFNVQQSLAQVDSDTADWAIGLDFTPADDTRFNVQAFQRIYFNFDPGMFNKEKENGYSLYLSSKFSDRLEAQFLWISSLERNDWLARPKLIWTPQRNWRVQVGADVFNGSQAGIFGQFNARDRGYFDVRYSF
jgi:hypothetical protein